MAILKQQVPTLPEATFLTMGIYQQQAISQLIQQLDKQDKWIYCLSSNYKCNHNSVLHLNQPQQNEQFSWLEKIITGAQTSAIFIQSLELNQLQRRKLKQLCNKFKVLVIKLECRQYQDNLIYGPWL